jgi:hypothetical protein
MSNECERCSNQSLECKCEEKNYSVKSIKWSKRMPKIEILEKDLLELIFWARRYCDRRSTYAPTEFNWLYERICGLYPDITVKDQFDDTLYNNGECWPYAQDGQYNPNTGAYDAIPSKKIKKE